MQATSPIPRQTVGRTFIVALALMGAVVIGQIGAVGYGLVQKHRTPSPAAERTPEPAAIPPEVAVAAAPEPVFPGLGALPTPAVSGRGRLSSEARVSALVEQAKAFRARGDTNSALIKLREAQTLSGEHPLVIAEMALTYELMAVADKALEQWQRLSAMGEAGGALTHLARLKLDPAFAMRTPDFAEPLPAGMGALPDLQGVQPGSVLGLMEIQTVQETDPAAEKKFSLKIGLRARPGSEIDVRDVVIQVLFYDMLDGEHIVQTNASVSSRWITAPADWRDDGIEILEVGYLQPKLLAEDLLPEESTRQYHGYIVRVYYKEELEDVRAEPVSLLNLFPSSPQLEPS